MMQNPGFVDPRIPRPPEDDSVIVIDNEEGVRPEDAYRANPVNQALRKAEILHERKMETTPNFKSLGELKEIFQSNLIVRVHLEGFDEPVDFRIKRADPVTLMLVQKSLIVLLNQALGDDKDILKTENQLTEDELMERLDSNQMDQLVDATAKTQEMKFDIILANVIEPELDREFLETAGPEVIDTLYDAIAGNVQGGQQFLNTFPDDGEQPQQ